jgi:hypothetical protein
VKVRNQGGEDTKQRSIHDEPKNAGQPIGLGPTKQDIKLSTFLRYLMEVA